MVALGLLDERFFAPLRMTSTCHPEAKPKDLAVEIPFEVAQ
jgi:hypothetical protein